MKPDDIRAFLNIMDGLKPGVAIRKGNDSYWYAAYVPTIVGTPVEVNWHLFGNPLDAIRFDPEKSDDDAA